MSNPIRSFDLTSRAFKNDPMPVVQEMRASGDLVRVKLPIIGKCWLTTTHAATTGLLKGADKFALEPKNAGRTTLTWWWFLVPKYVRQISKNMLTSDEPDHRRLRGLVDQAFHRQNINELRIGIEKLCDDFLDRLAEPSADGTVDFVDRVARPFPLTVICEMLGIPEQDRSELTAVFEGMLKTNKAVDLIRLLPKFKTLTRRFEALFAEARENPGPGLITALVHAENEGDQLNENELVTMVYLLFVAGHETTVHLLSGGLWALSRFPDQRSALMDNPSLLETGVDELLRYVSPVMITKPRFVKADMEFHGAQLKQKEMVMGFLLGANYDESVFENPDQLNLSRKPNPHTAFGGGIHFCLGFQLAKMEAQIMFTKLLERYPDIELATETDDVAWFERFGLRGMEALPVIPG